MELLDRWTFLIYSGALDERGFDYPTVLLNRYHKRGLNFVYVMPSASNPAWLRSVSNSLNGRAQGFSIALDERGTLAELLGVPTSSHETYTVFVGPDTRVRFAVRKSLPSDAMRQLVERNILGTIDYSPPSPPPGYVVGSPVPEIAVRNARTGRSIPLSTLLQGQGTVLFYRANCTSCGIESEIHRLATLERMGINMTELKTHAIFSYSYSWLDFKSATARSDVSSEIYVATHLIPEWEDPYRTATEFNRPMAIEIEDNYIAKSTPLPTWMSAKIADHRQRTSVVAQPGRIGEYR